MFIGVKKLVRAIISTSGKIVDRLTSKWVLIVGHSMHPTLYDGQRVRVSRCAYFNSEPARWDVVLFEHPERARFWETKRIVGLPGESVRLEERRLFIDAREIEDLFLELAQPQVKQVWDLQADEYIVLGDNRSQSTDSRSFGTVPRRNIVGKVIIKACKVEDEFN